MIPSAWWMAFVSALPRWFAPSMSTMQAEGPSAECFDESLPRHPPKGGPGARIVPYSQELSVRGTSS